MCRMKFLGFEEGSKSEQNKSMQITTHFSFNVSTNLWIPALKVQSTILEFWTLKTIHFETALLSGPLTLLNSRLG